MNAVVEMLHRRLRMGYAESAVHWREVALKFIDTDLQLSIFAYQQAQENERLASEEEKQANQTPNYARNRTLLEAQ